MKSKKRLLKIFLSISIGGIALANILANNFENQIYQKVFKNKSVFQQAVQSEKKINLSALNPVLVLSKAQINNEALVPLAFTTVEEILSPFNKPRNLAKKTKIIEGSELGALIIAHEYISKNIQWKKINISKENKKILKDSVVQIMAALNKEEKIDSIIQLGVSNQLKEHLEVIEKSIKNTVIEIDPVKEVMPTKEVISIEPKAAESNEKKPNIVAEKNKIKKQSKTVVIQGAIAEEAKKFAGHFEVGFYRGITIEGNPVGAPSPLAILKNGSLEFSLEIPRSMEGYVFARFYSSEKSSALQEWHGFPTHIVLREVKDDKIAIMIPVRTKKLAPETVLVKKQNEEISISLKIGAMFTEKNKFLPLEQCNIKLRGTKHEVQTDKKGLATLKLPKTIGKILLEITKAGYLPQIVEVSLSETIDKYELSKVELASKEAIKHMARSVGVNVSNSASVLIIDIKNQDGEAGLPGISTQLSLKSEGPFYFSEKGFPQAELKSTSLDGRIIFFNVEAGVGALEPFVFGAEITPIVISSMGMGDLVYQKIEAISANVVVSGKVLDPIQQNGGGMQPIAGAKVHIVGANESTETDLFGAFQIPGNKFIMGADHIIEVSKAGYFNHRYKLKLTKNETNNLSLYLFSTNYITSLAKSVDMPIDPDYGILIGKVDASEKIKIDILADHSVANEAKDFYFDAKNMIQASHAYTDPEYGTYVIFKTPTGRDILQGYNKKGEIRYYNTSYFSPATVNVLVE